MRARTKFPDLEPGDSVLTVHGRCVVVGIVDRVDESLDVDDNYVKVRLPDGREQGFSPEFVSDARVNRIVSPALLLDHKYVVGTMHPYGPQRCPAATELVDPKRVSVTRGFMDLYGEFHDPFAAYVIARDAGQFCPDDVPYTGGMLHAGFIGL